MKTETAIQLGHALNDILGRMGETIHLAQSDSSEDEFKAYRSAMGRAMGAFVHEVMNPHYEKYPESEPENSTE